jgi:hypothetical protein
LSGLDACQSGSLSRLEGIPIAGAYGDELDFACDGLQSEIAAIDAPTAVSANEQGAGQASGWWRRLGHGWWRMVWVHEV